MLRIKAVSHFFGPRLILREVSLEVPAGAVTLLAGANGAGKSTLLKIMAGLISPSSGEVEHGPAGKGDALVGYLGHQTFLYPEMSAAENLAFWAALHGLTVDPAALLARVDLEPFAGEKAGAFSRGMAQRLNLARVFMLEPDILLLDEPGTGLDAQSTAILQREILAMKERGAAIVWITHNLDGDVPLADHVAYLANKKLAWHGPASGFVRPGASSPAAPSPAPGSGPCAPVGGGPC